MHLLCSNTHLSPGVHCFVLPVAEPSPATDAGVPLLVFSIGGREIDGIGPSLEIQTSEQVTQEKGKKGSNWSRHTFFKLTPFSVGSPSKFSSTYQSPSHCQLLEGSWKLSRGWCCRPVTSLHCQRSLGSKRSEKPSTGFQRWQKVGQRKWTALKPVALPFISY